MKILVSFRHKKAVQPFARFIETLLDRGHDITVAIHERDEKIAGLFERPERLRIVTLPDGRRDSWSEAAELVRGMRDVAQYLKAPYRGAGKLRQRAYERLLKQLAVPRDRQAGWSGDTLLDMGDEGAARLERVLDRIEQAIPADQVTRDLLARVAPDVVLATPLLHFGGSQVEVVKAARGMGILVGMLLFSWDNLSTKGAFHTRPDHVFVWNARQRDEAEALHGVPPDRVTITGAPRFDGFFTLRSLVSPESFRSALCALSVTSTVLYLCSSRLVSEKEVNFIRQWVRAVRQSPFTDLRESLLVVRSHPDLPLAAGPWLGEERTFRWEGLSAVELRARPLFGDARTVLLDSDYGATQVLYESIVHADAVVGLNTSAEIEAGIVGRPVFTVLADAAQADGQQSTLHFHYLTEAQGGFVRVAASLEEHVAQLAAEIQGPRPAAEWQERVTTFVRPHGWNRPAGEVLADAVVEVFAPGGSRGAHAQLVAPGPPAALVVMPTPSVAPEAAQPMSARRVPSSDARPLRVRDADIELWVMAANGVGPQLPPSTRQALDWLRGQIDPGQVIWDVTAGRGLFALSAARGFGCTVLALESNLVALYELWQNTLINACDGLVVPLPFKAGSRASLRMERFDRFAADAGRQTPRVSTWREHDPGQGVEVLQPAVAVPLGWALDRWKLPPPHAIRATLGSDATDIVAAIASLAPDTPLHALVLEGPPDRLAEASVALARAGLTTVPASAAGRRDVLGYNRAARA